MNRRQFIATTAALSTGTLLFPNVIKNSAVFDLNSLERKSLSLYELERIIMTNYLFFGEYPEMLVRWGNAAIEEPDLKHRIQCIKDDLTLISLAKIKSFSRRKPDKDETENLVRTFDEIYDEINSLKKAKKLEYIENRGKVVLLNNNSVYDILSRMSFFNRFNILDLNNIDDEVNNLIRTLDRLAPEALHIKEASEIAGIPLEDVLAFAYVESRGREFAVSKNGDVGRFQLNSNVLSDIYKDTTYQDNELAEYIRRSASFDTFLEDLVSNPKLNVAVGINLMRHKRDKTENYYPIAYHAGIRKVSRLSRKIKNKLNNPEKITENDLRYYVLDYFNKFTNARHGFIKLRTYLA